MRSVLDSSVAFKWEVPEVDDQEAIRLREAARQKLHDPIAPDTFPVELAHVLTRAERRGRVPPHHGWALCQFMMAGCPMHHPYLPLMPRACQLSSRYRIGVYDCQYVALTERERCELVTADARLVSALSPTSPFVRPLPALP